MRSMTLACPKCGGTQLQNIRMIYEGGVNRSSTSGYTFTTDGNSNSIGTFQGTNTSTSALAQRFAPPYTGRVEKLQKGMRECWLGGVALVTVGLFFAMVDASSGDTGAMTPIAWLAVLAGLGFFAYGFYEKSKIDEATSQDYHAREKFQEWSNTIVCHTCSNQFVNGGQSNKSQSIASFQDYIRSGK